MAQFDVYRNTAPSKSRVPYLLDVQADLLGVLATRVVIPLVKRAAVGDRVIRHLHVEVVVKGQRLIAVTSELAGIATKSLGARVGSLAGMRSEIVRALDVITSGV